ncbi:MAG: M6 family metalloprotease domain-containing protein [Bacteroidales bacterium]|nr:M6 family metalloprotease domain-containing protein [Bacteroidales bacterium]
MKKVLTGVLALLMGCAAFAIPADRRPIHYTQPDGTTITILLHGDEFEHYATDLDGQPLALGTDGFYRPATDIQAARVRSPRMTRSAAQRMQAMARDKARVSNIGEKRIPVVLVNFTDTQFRISDPKAKFEALLNQHGYSYNGANGSVQDYYVDNSQGQFRPVFDVFGPYDLDNKSSYYAGSDGTANAHEAVVEALRQAAEEYDLSIYDSDGDGIIDMTLMYYAGYNQAEGGPTNTIWPHQWSVQYSEYANQKVDGLRIGKYFCTSEYKGSQGGRMCSIGTTCHEFAHSLGLPDWYDTDYEVNGITHGLAEFSPMCHGSYLNDSRTPPYFNVEERVMLGWVDREKAFTEVAGNGTLKIGPVYENHAYTIQAPTRGEYFYLEFRDGTGWDSYLPEGMVVYHADKSSRRIKLLYETGYGSYDTYYVTARELWDDWESYNKLNSNGEHPCFYVVPASDQDNLSWGYVEYYGQYYSTGASATELVFPGEGVYRYQPVDWDNNPLDIVLSDIQVGNGFVQMTVSGSTGEISEDPSEDPSAEPEYPDLGYNYIICASTYQAGDSFEKNIRLTEGCEVESVQWRLDGKILRGSKVELPAGTHTLSAHLTLTNGYQDVIEQVIVVE